MYSLIATAGYFLGIDTGHDRLNLAITDFCGDIVYSECNISYEYENTEACFQSLTDKVNAFIEEAPKSGPLQIAPKTKANARTEWVRAFLFG